MKKQEQTVMINSRLVDNIENNTMRVGDSPSGSCSNTDWSDGGNCRKTKKHSFLQ